MDNILHRFTRLTGGQAVQQVWHRRTRLLNLWVKNPILKPMGGQFKAVCSEQRSGLCRKIQRRVCRRLMTRRAMQTVQQEFTNVDLRGKAWIGKNEAGLGMQCADK